MKTKQIVFILIIVLVTSGAVCFSKRSEIETDPVDLGPAQTAFGLELLRELNQESPEQTIILSPVSISQVMGLVMSGARGQTRQEIRNLLKLPEAENLTIDNAYLEQYQNLGKVEKTVLKIANSIWYKSSFSIKKDYLKSAEKYFKAEITGLDFSGSDTIDRINGWVSDNTMGKIKQIILPPIDPLKVFLAVNAVYFKGSWLEEFDRKRTRIDIFKLLDGTEKKCNMMAKDSDFRYYEDDSVQAVDLLYSDGEYSMTIILPKARGSINDFISKLDQDYLNGILADFALIDGYLMMPRYKLEYQIDLDDVFPAMGMTIPFDLDSADFSGISEDKLYIDEIKHKTYLEVNEEGTEAAAVTSVGLKTVSIPKPGFVMKVNHPFFFMIRKNNTALFMGKIVEPME